MKVNVEIEKYLSQYDQVIIYDVESESFDITCSSNKHILILGKKPTKISAENVTYQCVNENMFIRIKKLFNAYEFSDRIQIISDTSLYPSIFNYVKTGIMTQDEAVEALFS